MNVTESGRGKYGGREDGTADCGSALHFRIRVVHFEDRVEIYSILATTALPLSHSGLKKHPNSRLGEQCCHLLLGIMYYINFVTATRRYLEECEEKLHNMVGGVGGWCGGKCIYVFMRIVSLVASLV